MCDESDTAAWSPRATEGVVLLGLSLGRSAVALTSDYVLPDSTGTGLAMVNVAVPTLLLSATFVALALDAYLNDLRLHGRDDTARAAESRFKTVIYDDAIADLDWKSSLAMTCSSGATDYSRDEAQIVETGSSRRKSPVYNGMVQRGRQRVETCHLFTSTNLLHQSRVIPE